MYLEFFKFNKSPFHITPDPDFLFLSPSHKEASASIFYGIEARKGFVAVTGEVGVGKTTILRSYLEGTDPEKIRIVYIFNAALSFGKLLKQICSELGIESAGEDPAELVELLFHYLIDQYRKDRNVVLIIDEAQNMPVETLERLRMLSNLETSHEKLIQLILVGQPEFEAKLNLPELRQLKQRIAIRSRIEALTGEESIAYIHHRLMRASSFHNPVFTKRALRLIIKQANGIPRTINILCDNALVTAFGYRRKPVDEKIVKEVVGDFGGGQSRCGFNWKIIWVPAVVACFTAAVFVSPNLMPGAENHAPGKQLVSARVHQSLPAPVKVAKSKNVCTIADAPREKNGPATPRVDHDVQTAQKPKTKRVVARPRLSVKPTPKKIKAAAAAAEISPAAISAATGKSGPSTGGGKPVSEAASRNGSVHAAPPVLSPARLSKVEAGRPVVVKRGDSVSKLLFSVYGRANAAMLESFKELNPQIKDINKLLVGEKILLP